MKVNRNPQVTRFLEDNTEIKISTIGAEKKLGDKASVHDLSEAQN